MVAPADNGIDWKNFRLDILASHFVNHEFSISPKICHGDLIAEQTTIVLYGVSYLLIPA